MQLQLFAICLLGDGLPTSTSILLCFITLLPSLSGPRYVELYGMNDVSNMTVETLHGVTKGPCYFPKVTIELTDCELTDPECGGSSVPQHYFSESLQVPTDIVFDCESTQLANFTWEIFKVGG